MPAHALPAPAQMPAVQQVSLDSPVYKMNGSEGSAYYKMSGTSMASAVVAGAVALLLQKEPTLTPDEVKYRLMNSVQPFATAQGCASGAGYLDIYAATKTSTTQNANTGLALRKPCKQFVAICVG